MKKILCLLVITLIVNVSCGDQKGANNLTKNNTMSDKGLVEKISSLDFNTTYEKLRSTIDGNPNLNILLELDHSKNAASAGLELGATRIIMFGNPKLGTALMKDNQTAGIDLPQKILVFEKNGVVTVAYNDPAYLKTRHALSGNEEIFAKISGALDKITTAAIAE